MTTVYVNVPLCKLVGLPPVAGVAGENVTPGEIFGEGVLVIENAVAAGFVPAKYRNPTLTATSYPADGEPLVSTVALPDEYWITASTEIMNVTAKVSVVHLLATLRLLRPSVQRDGYVECRALAAIGVPKVPFIENK